MKRLLTAVTACSALLLAACGSTPASPDDGASPAARDLGPLAEFMGYADFDQEASQAENEAKQAKVEELTAACMKEEGFEYQPATYPSYQDPNQAIWELSGTREFAEKYGYGIAISNTFAPPTTDDEWVDPNAEYVEAMSESERQAYFVALHGPGAGGMGYGGAMMSAAAPAPVEAEPSGTDEAESSSTDEAESSGIEGTAEQSAPEDSATADPDFAATDTTAEPESSAAVLPEDEFRPPSPEESGCSGRASAEVWPTMYTEPDDELTQMWDELNRRTEAINSDPQMVEAIAAWSDCTAEKGFPGLEREPWGGTSQAALQEEWSELHGATFTVEDGGGWSVSSPEEPVTPDPADVEAFKQKEIAQAVADFDCSVALTELRQTLQFAMEEKFVEEYSAQLTKQRELENG